MGSRTVQRLVFHILLQSAFIHISVPVCCITSRHMEYDDTIHLSHLLYYFSILFTLRY